jgi:hypothetical protein
MDWIDVATGLAFGAAASAMYFASLRLGIRAALRTTNPGAALLMGSALRILLLLLAGWAAAQISTLSVIGFGAAFLMVRYAAVAWARAPLEWRGR